MTHLHAVIVSYQRLPLLVQCVESFKRTVRIPHSLVIVDNGSTEDVVRWIVRESKVDHLLLKRNHYPGFATNRGWELMPPETTMLMRSDNDSLWLDGWDAELEQVFTDPSVGQYGPHAAGDEDWLAMENWPVGGNSIIRRELWDLGVRYDESPWHDIPIGGMHEDALLYHEIASLNYRRVWSTKPGLVFAGMRDAPYDKEVAEVRGRVWYP